MTEIIGQDEDDLLEVLSSRDLESDVTKGIQKLPPQCREIFLLSRFDLLTYQEISEKLNISVNTVKTQISRALDQLRGSLKKYL
jgi:RNA polymerase sigma-70 factor (ECF subfamily)